MYYDMHVHSTFSTDSELEMEKGILRAIELGLTGIAFTDHLDIDYIDHEEEFQYDFQEYFRTIEAFRDKYASRLDILTAVEIGLQPHVIEATKQRIAGLHFDYKIGSTHLIKRRDPYYGAYFKKAYRRKKRMTNIWKSCLEISGYIMIFQRWGILTTLSDTPIFRIPVSITGITQSLSTKSFGLL